MPQGTRGSSTLFTAALDLGLVGSADSTNIKTFGAATVGAPAGQTESSPQFSALEVWYLPSVSMVCAQEKQRIQICVKFSPT